MGGGVARHGQIWAACNSPKGPGWSEGELQAHARAMHSQHIDAVSLPTYQCSRVRNGWLGFSIG